MANHRSAPLVSITTTNKWMINQDSPNTANTTPSHRLREDFYVRNKQMLTHIKHKFSKIDEEPLACLMLVDTIQRSGIDYHFQEDIDEFLERYYAETMAKNVVHKQQDLFKISLSFRLLRQQGYNVAADMFNIFKDKDGDFREKHGQDISGLTSLYEASQLIVEGEDVLEEAGNFSKRFLNSKIGLLDNPESKIVMHTLRHPYHRSLARYTAKEFLQISNLGLSVSESNMLHELVKIDSDMVGTIHQEELFEISRWWKELGLVQELNFVRDQPLKWHMWSISALTDPGYAKQRIELTKPISLVYVIDDIFDIYGTLDELILFTEAVNRWEISATEKLPHYMKICFNALYDTTNDIGCKVYKDYGWNPVDSLKKAWASLFDAFLVEAKWFASGNVPNSDEYLRTAIVSSGAHVVLEHMFFLLGEGTNNEKANIVEDYPGIITSVATILRLWDDLGSAKDENQDGKDGSYITCYMKEHENSSLESAKECVYKMISEAWKKLNKECLTQNHYSNTFKKASLNLARMVSLMYKYDENQSLPELEEYVNSVI